MAKRPRQVDYNDVPKDLSDHPFFGLKLDEEQAVFRDAIWNSDVDAVFVSARAGCGKTLVSVATSVLLCKYHLFDSITYIMNPVAEYKQGYLPGGLEEKSSVYFSGLYQALIECGENPEQVIFSADMDATKAGNAYVSAITSSFLRGENLGSNTSKTIAIIDEAQNYTTHELRTVLTRLCNGSKAIVIGHDLQCDLRYPSDSGFAPCRAHFASKNNPRFAFCKLNTSHRSLVASVADEPWL